MQTLKFLDQKKTEPTKTDLDLSESELDRFFKICKKESLDLETTLDLICDKFQGLGISNQLIAEQALKERLLI